jgi:glycine hydroxymethyltransferase
VPVERGEVDTDVLAAALTGSDVALVYLDLQNSRHLLDVGAAAACVRRHSPGTALHVDCSHTLGLVLGGAVPNPLDLGADSMGGSTHKSFPGPHKGVLFTRSEEVRARLESAQFVLVSSHHFAETLALGIAAREFEHFGPGYAQQVVANARRLGTALLERGFDVAGAGDVITDNHQVWVHVGDADVTNELSGRLAAGGIRVNVQVDMPGLPGPALRLGANETTFEGATEPSMELLADAFAYARDGDAGRVSETREAVLRSYGRPYHLDIPLR